MTGYNQKDEVFRTLSLLFRQGQVIEVRAITGEGISSGYYNDLNAAAKDICDREKDAHVTGIYVTLNEVNPALLARRANRIKHRLERKDTTTSDVDIIRRRWLPIDIDPVRPSGVSSSDEEHARALSLASSVAAFLSEQGWPDPLVGDSGNGAHLLYRIDLSNDEESRKCVKSVLELLDWRFSDAQCKVDTANFNAARIWKIYGTISRKGDNLPDRPHRRSKLLKIPSGLQDSSSVVSAEQIQRLLASWQPDSTRTSVERSTSRSQETGIDLASWLSTHNLSYTEKPYNGGRLFVLADCPFSSAHSDGAYAIQFANGAIFAGCHHDSCGGGRQRWSELRALFEPVKPDIETRLARLRSERIRAKNEAEGRCRPTEYEIAQARALYEAADPEVQLAGAIESEMGEIDEKISSRCTEILESADPLSFMLETFASVHEGDQTVAECLVHSLASRCVINSKGLHVSITGESGKGKSHAIETMKSLVPKKFRLEGRMSDKALFYMEDLCAGSVISLDDVSLSDQMQEVLKGVTSSFQKPFLYRTVNKERKVQVCTIPQRCVWWIAKVEGPGDDQVFNRMLTCWIDDSEVQDKRVLERTLSGAESLPVTSGPESEEVRVCRQIWDSLSEVWVVIPFATRIRFQSAENRRNPDMLLDLIRTNAALNQRQRESKEIGNVRCVIASRADFDEAARLYETLNGESGAQANKLTKRESDLIAAFTSLNQSEVSIAELQQLTGLSNSTVGKLLHGYHSYGKTYSGLLDKCPAVSYLDRTVTRGDEGCSTMRRTRVYLWDALLYDAWEKGGSVWLCDDEDHDPDDHDDSNPGSSPEPEEATLPYEMSLSDVNSRSFVQVPGLPDHHRCSVCGKRPTQYQERVSHCSQNIQRMLCSSCYRRAVSREVASIIPLPGVIDKKALVRRSFPSGRCQVCDLKAAVWSDPVSQVHLCDQCYERLDSGEDDPNVSSPGPP
ncbi:hypothetical protein [Methanospirillum lacunae]|uniref:Uncharacterized protein n=1 Tax=Methanospirillum lacunae TaxID=668570 RepID=A0A2V2N490_9EURY|nr:hypothetical protein [Methanospirillum lacunae]PWR72566.1 hypothetical protein DK846_06255 [Methanospirillum lacunae]